MDDLRHYFRLQSIKVIKLVKNRFNPILYRVIKHRDLLYKIHTGGSGFLIFAPIAVWICVSIPDQNQNYTNRDKKQTLPYGMSIFFEKMTM